VSAARVVLLPPVAQRVWGWPAVANFAAGGLGAGLYLVAAVAGAPGPARWLGPALVLAGFLAVAAEAGRPLRGPRVLARLGTSWMSRELALGAVFAAAAALDARPVASAAAVAFVLAQGMVLRGARGVPAWSVGIMPVVLLASALVSGGGLWLLLAVASGRPPTERAVAALLVLLILDAAVWRRYRGTAGRTEDGRLPGGAAVAPGAPLATALALAPGLVWPRLLPAAAAVAGLLMVAGPLAAKAAVIRGAGRLRAITLPAVGRASALHSISGRSPS